MCIYIYIYILIRADLGEGPGDFPELAYLVLSICREVAKSTVLLLCHGLEGWEDEAISPRRRGLRLGGAGCSEAGDPPLPPPTVSMVLVEQQTNSRQQGSIRALFFEVGL